MSLYSVSQRLARSIFRPYLPGLAVEGTHHVPGTGAFLLVTNHESILDPILIQAYCPRPLHTMAKSTQFHPRLLGWYMVQLNAFPVRRYQVDPQAVRVVLRRLGAGQPVGIYVEGERSWDGRLGPPRLGTLRLILKAGVPVVPCAVSGSYAVWPRWARRPQRAPVRIRFGEPLRFPQSDDRLVRENLLRSTEDRLMGEIRALMIPGPSAGDLPAVARDTS